MFAGYVAFIFPVHMLRPFALHLLMALGLWLWYSGKLSKTIILATAILMLWLIIHILRWVLDHLYGFAAAALIILAGFCAREWEKKKTAETRKKEEEERFIQEKRRQKTLPPYLWCVSIAQLDELGESVKSKYPERDPSAYEVVDDIIKPDHRGCGYALVVNPNGLRVRTFVTHTWGEGFKSFVRELHSARRHSVDLSAIWICFLANPQTWPRADLKSLLGDPWTSPFAKALAEAKCVVAIRNDRQNLYERLWCVFELFHAHRQQKRVVPVGKMPASGSLREVGINATCSDKDDKRKLLKAMSGYKQEINAWIGQVMFS